MEVISAMIHQSATKKISEEEIAWAVRALFGNLMHWCLMATTSKMEFLIKSKRAPFDLNGIRFEMCLTNEAICEKLDK
jgi:hypothetical protein